MTSSREKHVGESSASHKKSKRQSQCHRHTVDQIQKLEAFFKLCPYPDEDQRNQLSREVELDAKQIKFWFQNRRTLTKTENERLDNGTLRKENERFHCEIMAMKEAMKNIICPQCDGPPIGEEERARNLEIMKMENQRLRKEHERYSNFISNVSGGSFVMGSNLAPSKSTLGSPSNSSYKSLLRQNDFSMRYHPPFHPKYNHNNVRTRSINLNNIPILSPSSQEDYEFHHDNRESIISEIVVAASNELLKLVKVNDPIWVKSSSDERSAIHRESYDIIFPNPNRPYKSSIARIESSRDCGVVPMTATGLIQIFLDPTKWMNMFLTIVTKAKTIKVFDSGNFGGSIQLMYEKLHILSPLVESRDFFFIRSCRQLDLTTWIMVDVSYDLFKEIQSGVVLSYAWKFPSGCVIQDIGNGQSMVTWIEHVQVDEKNQANRVLRDLLWGHQTYGAKRWIVTLQRMSERYNFAMGATFPTRHDLKGVINNPKGLENVMEISQRMVKIFFEILNMSDKVDFPTSLQLNNRDWVSIRKNEESTQSKGFIATAATSLSLPLSFQTVFNFFKDNKTRHQWDVLTNENNMTELARVPTGIFPENGITIIQPYMQKENNLFILQESSIDEIGAFLIYAPIDLPAVTSIVSGGDAKKIAIFPSGIIISPSDHLSNMDNNGNAQNGSILTVTSQISIYANNDSISQEQRMEAVAYIHNLLSSTILKIKTKLDCFN